MSEQQPPPSIAGSLRRLSLLIPRLLNGMRDVLRGYVELLRAELSASAKALGLGLAFAVVAVGLTLLAAIFVLVAAALGITALGLPMWLSFLIVGVATLLIVTGLALAAKSRFKKVTLPMRTLAVLDELGKAPAPPPSK
ncbi:MAG: phage holin family protein [Actinobacteria bacterium]|nr:phage holin family protein [Actinomycetota bacterium]